MIKKKKSCLSRCAAPVSLEGWRGVGGVFGTFEGGFGGGGERALLTWVRNELIEEGLVN